MVKTLLLVSFLVLGGCSSGPAKVKTETVDVYKPVLYCPKPDWTGLRRPILAIDGITSHSPPGEVAKRYKASIIQLQDYSKRLERALKQYDESSESYDKLNAEIEATRKRQVQLQQIASP